MQDEHNISKLNVPNPQYLIVHAPHTEEQHVNFFQFVSELYKRRWFILSAAVAFTAIAIGVAFTISPVYQTKTYLTEPRGYEYQNLLLNLDSQYTNKQIFLRFAKELAQKSNVLSFLKENGSVDEFLRQSANSSEASRLKLLNQFAEQYKITIINHNELNKESSFGDDSLEVELVSNSTELDISAAKAKKYIEYINNKVIADIIVEQKATLQGKIKSLEGKMFFDVAKVTSARHKKIQRLINKQSQSIASINDEIVALNEQDKIIKRAELHRLREAIELSTSLNSRFLRSSVEMPEKFQEKEINSKLYLLGKEYLTRKLLKAQTEKHASNYEEKLSALNKKLFLAKNDRQLLGLQKITDDMPYSNAENIQKQIDHLKSLSFEANDISCFSYLGAPSIDPSPVKPRRLTIIVLGFILGVFLAVFVVFLQASFRENE